jgi:2-oxoglutarate dehydrogenase complex dehydrogenase (E1) component-like enzyme
LDPNIFETANAGFAQAMYEEYLRDPQAVSAEWRRLFEGGVAGAAPVVSGNGSHPAATLPAAPPPATAVEASASALNQMPSPSRDPPPAWWRT